MRAASQLPSRGGGGGADVNGAPARRGGTAGPHSDDNTHKRVVRSRAGS